MLHFASPLGAMASAGDMEVMLTDDSLGLTPPGLISPPLERPTSHRARSTSTPTVTLQNFFMDARGA